ncbi:TniQ family protein [Paraburkholderia sp. RL17-381-BIF-C]|uniref:TniQ family protein n=1 Tax=Paraburkholderia sp. RL17-381-BIF-C TaxID=3031635 RepID=UPI0038BDAF59
MNTYFTRGLPLCRPKMLPDEWVETYLFRVARANGIRYPRLSDTESFRPKLAATALSKADGYPIWSATRLPRSSVVTRVNKIRYCPECMMQSRHIRSRWRLTAFDVCTIHHIRLKDDLAEPVMTKGYKQEGKYFVSSVTDEQLWAGAVCPMPSERRHVEKLWSGFERSIVENDIPGAFEQLTHILFLKALLDAVLTTTREFKAAQKSAAQSTELAQLVEKYHFSLAADFNGIRDFLDQITVTAHRDVVLNRLHRMLTDEMHRPTCFSELPIADLRSRLLTSLQRRAVLADEIPCPDHEESDGYVSLNKAASIIGCPSRLVKHLIDSGVCHGVRSSRLGLRRYLLLSSQAVEACGRWRASVATREQAMNELRIDRRGFLALLRAGLLRPIAVDVYKFFLRADLTDLCQRLGDVSRPFPSKAAHLHSLLGEWIPFGGCYRSASLEVLKEAFSGKFPIFRQMESSGLSAYFVDHTALERVRRLKTGEIAGHEQENCSSGQLSLLVE